MKETIGFQLMFGIFLIDNHLHLNSLLLAEIAAEQQRDRQGEKWSNVLGWHSANNLHEREVFAAFVRVVEQNVLEVATFIKWDLKKFSIKISTYWASVNGKLASNSAHNHPNSILSGVYYLKAPENCGGTFFADPRPAAQMLIPPVEEFNLWNFSKISYKPQEGTMLLFPSWLFHGVELNMSGQVRVSLNFDIGMSPVRK